MAALRYVVVASLAVLALAGCSSPDLSGVATYESYGTGSNGALMEGKLVLTDDCVYVESFGERILPVFPEDEVERGVGEPLRYDDRTYEDGDDIDLGGSMVEGALTNSTVPEGCSEDLRAWSVGQAD